MKNFILLSALFFILFSACKKSKDPEPANNGNNNGSDETLYVCRPKSWIMSKRGKDTIAVENGFLKMVALHAKTDRAYLTTISSGCALSGDFSFHLNIPYLVLSDTLNGGNFFTNVIATGSVMAGSHETMSTSLTNQYMYNGSARIFPSPSKTLVKNPEKADVYFTRVGSKLTAKIKIDSDSLELSDDQFTTKDLFITIGLGSDTLGKTSSRIKIDKFSLTGGGSNVESSDFNSLLLY